jgi:hypothetical protein
MATQFKNKVVKDVGQVGIIALETDAATRSTIIGLTLTNLTEFMVKASILIADDTSVQGFYIKDSIIPPDTTLHALSAGEKIILAPSNQLIVRADQNDCLDAVISYVDIV